MVLNICTHDFILDQRFNQGSFPVSNTKRGHSPASPSRFPTLTMDATTNPAQGGLHCPFPMCNVAYKRKSTLRGHLTGRCFTPDEKHPASDPIWQDEVTRELMHVFTRGGLSAEEKRQRAKQSTQRCWQKNAPTYKENARTRRQQIREVLSLASKLKRSSANRSSQV